MVTEDVTLKLTRAEALVLFEFLARESIRTKSDGHRRYEIEYPVELRVLWIIEGRLEATLVEPFQPDYRSLVEKARDEVIERAGEPFPSGDA